MGIVGWDVCEGRYVCVYVCVHTQTSVYVCDGV